MRVPSWVELMGRHAASSTLFTSATLRYRTTEPDGTSDSGGFDFWHGPDDRWRIEVSGEPVCVRTRTETFVRDEAGQMSRLQGRMNLPLLGKFNPFDVIGPRSMLFRLSERVRPVGPATRVQLGGRVAWSMMLTSAEMGSAGVEIVLDDESGMLLRVDASNIDPTEGRLHAELTGLVVHNSLDSSLFEWNDELAQQVSDKNAAPVSEVDGVQSLQERIDILAAMSRALGRRAELVEALAGTDDDTAARAVVCDLLTVSPASADAVLAMQIRRFSEAGRMEIEAELSALRSEQDRLTN